jgi:hypothetical protein
LTTETLACTRKQNASPKARFLSRTAGQRREVLVNSEPNGDHNEEPLTAPRAGEGRQ